MQLFQKNKFNFMREFREEPFIVFVQRNVFGAFGEVGVLLVAVSVQAELPAGKN